MENLNEVKTRILNRSPLDEIIGEAISVQKRAGRLMACCPFHNEKSPSFYIYHDHYHCYGCGAHGDAISFVQHQQGLGFMEALRWLARKYAIAAPELEQASGNIKQWKQAARLSQILLAAQEFFTTQIATPNGEAARQAFIDRGFSAEAIKLYGFGYAPDHAQALMNHLSAQGYKADELETTSLVTIYQTKAYDFFRHRMIIPIRDTHGRLIAFGGRALGNQQQKYKNSRYDKGSVLYGLDVARKAMRQQGRAIVVEGYLDTLQLHQHGLSEAVACQGTALTREHMRSLRSATSMVYLLFDGDQAGQNASLKALKEALNHPELQFKVALLPSGEDPDSYVRKHGREGIELILAQAEDLLEFSIQSKLQSAHATAIPSLVTQEFVPWLLSIEDPIKRSFLCQKIAELSGIPSATIAHAVSVHGRPVHHDEPPAEPLVAPEPLEFKEPTPLTPLVYELVAHIYFAQAGEFEVEAVQSFIDKELMLDSTWHFFIGEMLACLAASKIPAQQEAGFWVAGQSIYIMQLIARLKENAPAFHGQNRKNSLTRIQLATRQINIKNTVTSLKEQLTLPASAPQLTKDEWRQTLTEITKLSQSLHQIEREMRQI